MSYVAPQRGLRGIDVQSVPWWTFGAIAAFGAFLGYLAGREAR